MQCDTGCMKLGYRTAMKMIHDRDAVRYRVHEVGIHDCDEDDTGP